LVKYNKARKICGMDRVLVTGGLGYIGSHSCVELVSAGYTPVIIDNLSNSKRSVLDRLGIITGTHIPFYEGDIRDHQLLDQIFKQEKPQSVMHFAALKSVSESFEKPLDYYENNIKGTLYLMRAMHHHGVKSLIFSSSANIYGAQDTLPITEDRPTGQVTNPYGRTKFMMEEIMKDVQNADPEWSMTLLRYFNPVGAHESGLIGEDPDGIPSNLMPTLAKVANGELPEVKIFGDDFPTADGTGIRDYIHVVDLARGHIAALDKKSNIAGTHIYNLGTGHGHSVLEMITAYEAASGKKIPYNIHPRRDGDVAASYADVTKAKAELDWTATKTLTDMCYDSWRWVSSNASKNA